jgi:hypothetical protein
MDEFTTLVSNLENEYNIVFVAKPASYDIGWIRYMLSYTKHRQIPYFAVCISSMIDAFELIDSAATRAIQEQKNKINLSHFADEDAKVQLELYFYILDISNHDISNNIE